MSERGPMLGIGELVYDHVFAIARGKTTYIGSRGGGSVFNLLANQAAVGGRAIAIGVGGHDWFGESAKDELKEIGVDTSNLNLLKGKRTRVIFEVHPERQESSFESPRKLFSIVCPICRSRIPENELARLRQKEVATAKAWPRASFICFDRLTKERIEIARTCRLRGISTALDLGRIGYLRFFPAAQIVAALGAFDFVLCPLRVASSIARRAGFVKIEDLCLAGPRLAMFVTKGSQGMTVYDARFETGVRVTELPPTKCAEVIDDAGAGDAFLAKVLSTLASRERSELEREGDDHVRMDEVAARAVSELGPVLSAYGARGHIKIEQSLFNANPIQQFEGVEIETIRQKIGTTDPCPFCGTDSNKSLLRRARTPSRIGAKSNLALLLRRMFFVVERKDAIEKCRRVLECEGTAYAIGTGGSYPVASFLSLLFNRHGKLFTQAIRPLDYIRTARTTDCVLVISYSGKTEDCAQAIARAVELNVQKIVLVTGATNPKLAGLLRRNRDDVISFGRTPKNGSGPGRERGFVSIAGTVAPCTLWTAAVVKSLEMTQLAANLNSVNEKTLQAAASRLAEALENEELIAVLGGGLAWPAMLDLESKFVESGVGKIQLHEIKDFSHGRFVSLLTRGHDTMPVVCLAVGRWHGYEKLLMKKLDRGRTFLALNSHNEDVLGALELLVQTQFLAQFCADAVGRDISRPESIPESGLTLYRWKGRL